MKHMLLVYNCNVCEENHILKATWTVDGEMNLKNWSLYMENELVSQLWAEARRSFIQLHPNGVFDGDRVMLSQVIEEAENEKETARAKKE